jgi:magnesium-transporting ATPase (P-type)
MSVIVKDAHGKIMLYCKGADSIIIERLKKGQSDLVDQTNAYLEEYAKEGLRTLLLAEKELTQEEYEEFDRNYNKASIALVNREQEMENVSE